MHEMLDTTVAGGLPVTIGFDNDGDWWISHIADRRVKKPTHANWLYKRMSRDDEDRIIELVDDYRNGG